ncbi:MAG: FaeA/PapI family transcriptional regulator [Candidatus Hodarchaeales archaeon]|jgi:DNA-binding MarR family transcriptional regulator
MAYVNHNKLPRATDLILKALLESSKGVQTSEICETTSLSKRQVRYALDSLLKRGIIVRSPNLHDLRINLYSIAEEEAEN